MKIEFQKTTGKATLHNPLKNFELEHQMIENRLDPLTGHPTVVRTGRKFWQHQYTTDEKLLAEIAAQTREKCFFCPERVNKYTPRYPEEFIKSGRIIIGEACLFPNLFPQKEDSAVAVISQQHFIPLDQFQPELLHNAFKACALYLKRLYEFKGSRYCHIGFNYLFPAGSSIPHPHLQIIGGPQPDFLLMNLLKGSEKYSSECQSCYWDDLVDTEKELGERYVGRTGKVEWLTPFAATREDEVHGTVQGKSNFLEFDDEDWFSLADGISRAFRFYKDKGLSSCNFAIYSAPLGQKLSHFRAGIRIVSRSSVKPQPINDVWFSQNILYDGLVTEPPEETASALRRYFWV